MTKTIVCGIDSTPTAAAAARTAAELASALGARLHLLSAYGKTEAETVEIGKHEIVVSNEIEAERITGITAYELRKAHPGLDVTASAAEGKPGPALVLAADRLDADLIVVGNKRVQGVTRVFGSIARDVAQNANCDVYIAYTHG